jgi:hypothetical protein
MQVRILPRVLIKKGENKLKSKDLNENDKVSFNVRGRRSQVGRYYTDYFGPTMLLTGTLYKKDVKLGGYHHVKVDRSSLPDIIINNRNYYQIEKFGKDVVTFTVHSNSIKSKSSSQNPEKGLFQTDKTIKKFIPTETQELTSEFLNGL